MHLQYKMQYFEMKWPKKWWKLALQLVQDKWEKNYHNHIVLDPSYDNAPDKVPYTLPCALSNAVQSDLDACMTSDNKNDGSHDEGKEDKDEDWHSCGLDNSGSELDNVHSPLPVFLYSLQNIDVHQINMNIFKALNISAPPQACEFGNRLEHYLCISPEHALDPIQTFHTW